MMQKEFNDLIGILNLVCSFYKKFKELCWKIHEPNVEVEYNSMHKEFNDLIGIPRCHGV